MRTFTDARGRSWDLEITVATLKRIRAVAGVDLLEVAGGTLFDKLVADPVLLGDVLYAVVKPQADAQQVSDEDFGRALAGDVIDSATTALLAEIVAFFPSPRRRVLEQAMTTLAAWRAQALAAAERRLTDPGLWATVEQAIAAGGSSGSAPASSASTPPP